MQKSLLRNLLVGIILSSIVWTLSLTIIDSVNASGVPVIVEIVPPTTPTDTPTPTTTPTVTLTPTLTPTVTPTQIPILNIVEVNRQDQNAVSGLVDYGVIGENFDPAIVGYIDNNTVLLKYIDFSHLTISISQDISGAVILRLVNPDGQQAEKIFTIVQNTPVPTPTIVITDNVVFPTRTPTPIPTITIETNSNTGNWWSGSNGLLSLLPLTGIVLNTDNNALVLTPNQVASTGGVAVIAIAGSVEYLKYFFIPLRKRKRYWGLAVDKDTKKGVPLAVINLISATTKHIVATTITDMQGRYGLVVDPGEYYIQVEHPEYNLTKDPFGNGNYLGQIFKVSKAQNLAYTFVLSRSKESHFSLRIWLGTLWNTLVHVFEKIYPYLILATIAADLYFFTLSRDPAYIFLILWLVVFLIVFFALSWYYPKQWGVCIDASTGKPIPQAIVKLYSIKDVAPVDTQLTDDLGRFQFVTSKGEYQVVAMASGYKFPSKNSKHLDKEGRFVIKTNRGKYNYDLLFDKVALDSDAQPMAKFGMLYS